MDNALIEVAENGFVIKLNYKETYIADDLAEALKIIKDNWVNE